MNLFDDAAGRDGYPGVLDLGKAKTAGNAGHALDSLDGVDESGVVEIEALLMPHDLDMAHVGGQLPGIEKREIKLEFGFEVLEVVQKRLKQRSAVNGDENDLRGDGGGDDDGVVLAVLLNAMVDPDGHENLAVHAGDLGGELVMSSRVVCSERNERTAVVADADLGIVNVDDSGLARLDQVLRGQDFTGRCVKHEILLPRSPRCFYYWHDVLL